VFDAIAEMANPEHAAQAVRSLLYGLYPLDGLRGISTEGSLKLRQSAHWSTIVVDGAHGLTARERVADQLARLRQRNNSYVGPISLKFVNFDFTSGEMLAYICLPILEVMGSCISFELLCVRDALHNPPRRPTLSTLYNPDLRCHLLNSPARMLMDATPWLRRVVLNLGRPRVYLDGTIHSTATAGLLLPNAPNLRHVEVTGGLCPHLFNLPSYPYLEYLGIEATMDASLLIAVAARCQNIVFLRAVVSDRSGPLDTANICFPSLRTLVVSSPRLLKLIGSEQVSPNLETFLVAENHLRSELLTNVMSRSSIVRVGPASTTRTEVVTRGVMEVIKAANQTQGRRAVGLVLEDLDLHTIWTFIETWLEEKKWPQVNSIFVRNCMLTSNASLQIVTLARMIVSGGGELVFRGCSATSSEGRDRAPCGTLFHDSWRDAIHVYGKSIVRGQLQLHVE